MEVIVMPFLFILFLYLLVRGLILTVEAATTLEIYLKQEFWPSVWFGIGFAVRNMFRFKHRMVSPFKWFAKGFSTSWDDLDKLIDERYDRDYR